MFCMGAADVVLARCSQVHSPDGGDRLHPRIVNLKDNACLMSSADLIDPLSSVHRHKLEMAILSYCKEGLTPMACAHRHVSPSETEVMLKAEDWSDVLDQDMTLDLIVGLHNNVDRKVVVQLKVCFYNDSLYFCSDLLYIL